MYFHEKKNFVKKVKLKKLERERERENNTNIAQE